MKINSLKLDCVLPNPNQIHLVAVMANINAPITDISPGRHAGATVGNIGRLRHTQQALRHI